MRAAILGILFSVLIAGEACAEGAIVVSRDRSGSHVVHIIANKRTSQIVFDEANRPCNEQAFTDCEFKQSFSMACAAAAYSRGYAAWGFGHSIAEANDAAMRQCRKSNDRCVLGTNSECDLMKEMTLLCTDSIFAERERLRSEMARAPNRIPFIKGALKYLESTYCAYAHSTPPEDRKREATDLPAISVATGMRLGERVYWEAYNANE